MVIGRNRPDPTKKTQQFGAAAASYSPRRSRRSNISLVHLPPASPELNPTENVWQYLRQAYLSNRVFRDYDDVLEASSSAWNKLIAEHGRIASIGTRTWTAISQGP